MRLIALTLAMLAAAALFATGQPPATIYPAKEVKTNLRWYVANGDKHRSLLFDGETLVGEWRHKDNSYHPWNPSGFQAAAECPVTPPDPPRELISKAPNYGLDTDKLGPAGYTENGIPASVDRVWAALEDDVPDDSHKPRITVQGSTQKRETALREIAVWMDKHQLRGKVLLWSAEPGNPILTRKNFVMQGDPTVWLQGGDGTQLLCCKTYAGDTSLADLAAALARYDKLLFPNGGGGMLGVPNFSIEHAVIIGLICLLALALFRRR